MLPLPRARFALCICPQLFGVSEYGLLDKLCCPVDHTLLCLAQCLKTQCDCISRSGAQASYTGTQACLAGGRAGPGDGLRVRGVPHIALDKRLPVGRVPRGRARGGRAHGRRAPRRPRRARALLPEPARHSGSAWDACAGGG